MLPALASSAYLLMSALAFAAMARDKHAARRQRPRTPEATLHLLELLGGWPGSLLAQHALRHKTRKRSYQLVFWTIAALHAIAWAAIAWAAPR